jgi:hypothetical protein
LLAQRFIRIDLQILEIEGAKFPPLAQETVIMSYLKKRSSVEVEVPCLNKRKKASVAHIRELIGDLKAKQADLTKKQTEVTGWILAVQELDRDHMQEAQDLEESQQNIRRRHQKHQEEIIKRYNAGTTPVF